NKGIKYDVAMTEQCPLCEEDIQVGTVGPQGLVQHKGKKKCLATIKKKQEDVVTAKKPTLLAYLRRKDTTLPSASNLVKEAERIKIEATSQVVVSQATALKATPQTYTAQHPDEDTQDKADDVHPSTDQNLDSNPN
ncbi:hypothetical protein V8E53_005864, partial [Lactarius tabidus]